MVNLFSFQEANDHLSAPNCSLPTRIVWQIEFELFFCICNHGIVMFKRMGCPCKLKTKMLDGYSLDSKLITLLPFSQWCMWYGSKFHVLTSAKKFR